jgi:hypothetical protein
MQRGGIGPSDSTDSTAALRVRASRIREYALMFPEETRVRLIEFAEELEGRAFKAEQYAVPDQNGPFRAPTGSNDT